MTARQLIECLQEFPPDMPVMILDGFNGGGFPREINCGPFSTKITKEKESGDCEGMVGKDVVVMGYGCY
jgi:hypothetical protein